MSQDWQQRLKAAFKASGREPHRHVRLPEHDANLMQITGDANHAVIDLGPYAIVKNMQQNAAAFEGWSLALRRWCGAEKVTLQWKPPVQHTDPNIAKAMERHHQRFLYRVERFRSLFDWFVVARNDPFARSRVVKGEILYLNVAGNAAKEASRDSLISSKMNPESELEFRLLKDRDFDRYYGFTEDVIKDRQFPVGLFSKPKPHKEFAIFPGGTGAIDLVCLDDRHLWLFELKAKKNIPIGTITELLFYTSVIRDAVLKKFKYGVSAGGRAQVRPEMIEQKVNAITGVMLGHDLHPLLADPGLIQLLNQAVEARWNRDPGAPIVSFRADQIEQDSPLKIVGRGG